MLLYGVPNKKEYAYCQSHARTSALLPDMGQKEEGPPSLWPLITSSTINTIKMHQIGLTWFHSYYCIIFSCHSLHKKYVSTLKKLCNFNKNNTCFTKVLRALLRPPPPPLPLTHPLYQMNELKYEIVQFQRFLYQKFYC